MMGFFKLTKWCRFCGRKLKTDSTCDCPAAVALREATADVEDKKQEKEDTHD